MSEQWVSVEDRLPEDGGYVLVSDGDDVYMGYKNEGAAGEYMDVESGSMIISMDITHWMKLPVSPLNEDEELKLCPFCGGAAIEREQPGSFGGYGITEISCHDCSVRASNKDDWNTRTATQNEKE